MRSTFTLVHRDGTAEERPFLILRGREFIAEYLPRFEVWHPTDPGKRLGFAQHDTGEVVIFEPVIELFHAVRAKTGPLLVNSGYRSDAYQEDLYRGDPSGAVARPGSSPHRYGAAMDLRLPGGWTALHLAQFIRETSVEIGLPMARAGWRQYSGRFVHMDVVFLLFKPYTEAKNPNPRAWKPGVTW